MTAKTGRPRTRPDTMPVRIGRSDAIKILQLLGLPRGTPWPVAFERVREKLEAGPEGERG